MKIILKKELSNHEDSRCLAREFYDKHLKNSDHFTVFLEGGLGAGKTFLVREILTHFGVEDPVPSPTYTFINEYSLPHFSSKIAHFDFYRFENSEEFFHRGLPDIAEDKTKSCFVEWPEKICPDARASFTGKKFLIRISHGQGAGMRKIKIFIYD